MPFAATWIDLEGIMLSEISQTEKDKYHMISLICVILKIQQTSEYNKKEADSQIWKTNYIFYFLQKILTNTILLFID